MVLHAYAVAEDRAAGERAGRVNGEHADPFVGRSQRPYQLVRCGRLADPRCAGEADDASLPGVGRQCRRDFTELRVVVFDQADEPGHGAVITVARAGDQRRHIVAAPEIRSLGRRRTARDGGSAHDFGTETLGTVKINASPWPPPPQSAATPVPPPRRLSSMASDSTSRAPDIPIG